MKKPAHSMMQSPILPFAMATKKGVSSKTPCLPQHANEKQAAKRQFQLKMARTNYNYTLTYIDGLPFSANVPKAEKFTEDYRALVAMVIGKVSDNFFQVVLSFFKMQFAQTLPPHFFDSLQRNPEKFAKQWRELQQDLAQSVADGGQGTVRHKSILQALSQLAHLPQDLEKMLGGLARIQADLRRDGPTAALKSMLHYTLANTEGRKFVQASSMNDFADLYPRLPTPQALQIQPQAWMQGEQLPCLQDWYFGYLQVAGFNTTLLRGVSATEVGGADFPSLASLLQKMPLTDEIFQRVIGDAGMSLQRAAELKRLYVCDYGFLQGKKNSVLHGRERYLSAAVALFYWNPVAPPGYAPGAGAMQPVAIQLAQQHDVETAPIFTPNDSANANDGNGLKWQVAKYIVNAMQAIHHESVAHFGACHLAIEPVVLATHRQLAARHPVHILLKPHLRFTIHINSTARANLIVPGGVVETNVGPDLDSSLEMVREAFLARKVDDCHPERMFGLRGLDSLPDFPFRDDTLLLWRAIKNYVAAYLRLYYASDADVQQDTELQAWVNELVSPKHAAFRGMDGLRQTGNPAQPVEIDHLDYLIEIIAYFIYLAGPQHSSVNNAQFPLMSFAPCVMGTVYHPAPSQSTQLETEEDCLRWYPPMDVVLYTFSFEYLLSNVQYDRLGEYGGTPSMPYFKDSRAHEVLADFQQELAQIEAEIRLRNRKRPMPYLLQLPSAIANSTSI